MKFGLSKDQYEYILKTVVNPIAAKGGHVFCYGSRARGDHKKYSDLDLMVEGRIDLSQLISEIQETLIESDFPFKIDLVQLKDFADAYKPSYQLDKKPFSE